MSIQCMLTCTKYVLAAAAPLFVPTFKCQSARYARN